MPVHRFRDWTTHHAIYSHSGLLGALNAVEDEPRAQFAWREWDEQHGPASKRIEQPRRWRPWPYHRRPGISRDWSIYLGTAGTAPAMYPAQFTLNVTTPSCANDFVVFPIAAIGGTTQPNIVGLNNLYSGTGGVAGNGFCNRTPSGSDNGVAATVLWSYNVHALVAGGAVPTSPALSLDGAKVAFVESAAGSPAHFHVLAWKSKDGQAANLQNVTSPLEIKTFTGAAPVAGSGTASDLVLGTSSDTLSSPFVDYVRDQAYVGNDAGVLFRVNNVFCTQPSCANAAPSLDATWGTSGAVTVCAGNVLTGPVLDFVTLNVFVGCADGKLYSVSQAGTIKSITVGDGASKTYGGIVDPPIVDGVNGFVYAVSGSANNGAYGALVQAKTDLSTSVVAQIGNGNQCNIHAPTPNNAYFTSITSAGALMYVGGLSGTPTLTCTNTSISLGTSITIYGVGFGAGGVIAAGVPANNFTAGGGPGFEWAPLLEFFNAATGTDWLFGAALQSFKPNMGSANITAGFPAGIGAVVTEGIGTSGMVVDNGANTTIYPQAANIYFNALLENAACTNNTNITLTGGCAVKLTQANLQ